MDLCINLFRRLQGWEPSAIELKDWFLSFLKGAASERMMILKIDLSFEGKDIKNGFKEVMGSDAVKGKLSNAQSRRWKLHYQNKKPTGKPRIDELERYLNVYDMWKEKVQNRQPGDPSGWDEIIQHFEPGRTVSNERDRRLYQLYKQKAEKIISNVERGFFPGEY